MVTETLDISLMKGAQMDFVKSDAYSPALIAGRGYGKTVAFAAKAGRIAFGAPGGRGVLTQPTFGMIKVNFMPVWDQLFDSLRDDEWEYRLFQQGVPSEIAFKNGFIYDLRPATNEQAQKFRGPTYCAAGMDEIRNEDQLECYLALVGAVRAPGYSNHLFVTSTPEARRPWIKKIWRDHVDPLSGEPLPPEDYPKFAATMEDNWHLTEAHKKRTRALYGGDSRYAQQELDAIDVSLEGVAFEDFGAAHIRHPSPDHVFVRTLAGLDFGATNPTSMHELRLDQSNRVWVTREFYKRNSDDYDWIRAAQEWGLHEIVCDPSRSGKDIKDLRRRYGVNLKPARSPAKRFEDRVRLIRNRLALRSVGEEAGTPGLFISPDCPNAIAEITNLAFAQARVGEFARDQWEPGLSDHAFDDICYGLSVLDLPSLGRPRSTTQYEWVNAAV